MKPELQRIEAALSHLDTQDEPQSSHSSVSRVASEPAPSIPSASASISFKVQAEADLKRSTPQPCPSSPEKLVISLEQPLPFPKTDQYSNPPESSTELSFQRSLEASRAPALPKLEISDFNALPHDPGIVLQMIRKLETVISGWYSELQHILQRTRAVEAEGPAINGWLESRQVDTAPPNVSLLRHGDVEELMDYINEICSSAPEASIPKNHYILCGYNTDGQVWSRPCPPEELSSVSMAIARYQTLAQLRDRQQALERRLGAIALQITQLYQQHVG